MKTKQRRTIVRIALILFIAAFSAFLFVAGKEHTLLLDNKAVSLNGTDYAPFDRIVIDAGRGKTIELYPRDRDKLTTMGLGERLVFETYDKRGQLIARVKLRVPTDGDMILVNLPAFLAGDPEAVAPFHPLTE